jgi:cation diffusion facilitator family transporter
MDINSDRARNKQIRSVTLWGILLNIVLLAVKIVTGLLIQSSALIADGVHSLSDLTTDFIVLIGARLSSRPADETHPYGHKKFETISSLIIAVVLLVVSLGLIWSAASSIVRGEKNFPGVVVLIIASISVIAKEIIFRITRKVSRITYSTSLYANAWHHRSDALSSVAVLIGGIASLSGWGIADKAATIVVGFMIMGVAGRILYDGLIELSEHSADKDSVKTIKKILSEEKDICGWHALRTRKLGGELFIDIHILVNSNLSVLESHQISLNLEKKIETGLPHPLNILIHIDPDLGAPDKE